MGWQEDSDQGIEVNPAVSTEIELIPAPVAGKKRLVLGITLTSPVSGGGVISSRVCKKKGAALIYIDGSCNASQTSTWSWLGMNKQILKDTDESIVAVVWANVSAADLHWTANWANID
jgi:hypothetical protein